MDYMIERLKAMRIRLTDIDNILSEGKADIPTMTKLSKERATLEEPVRMFNDLERKESDQNDAMEMMKDTDPDIKAMGKEEFDTLANEIAKLRKELKIALLPKDENDDKNIIMEIRGAAGGDEAHSFRRLFFDFLQNQRKDGLLQTQIRKRCTPCSKSPCNRSKRQDSDIHCNSIGHA